LTAPRFRSVVVDVDSTLSAVEGIDWLASQRSDALRAQVAEATDRAMRGEISLTDIFEARMNLVAPSRDEVAALAREYVFRVEPGAAESLAMLTNAGVRLILVSGGIREAILPLARHLGIPDQDVNAVAVYFADGGAYKGFDQNSPMTRNGGKAEMVHSLSLEKPILGVGDGITDLEVRTAIPPAVDAFAAYTGVIERPVVTSAADYIIRTFAELPPIVLG
jgi:phosphoserine phosphatase